jgi:hypothetical protein
MKPSQHEQIAAAICRAHQEQTQQSYGYTSFFNIIEDLADEISNVLAADNRTFDRAAFIAKCGFPERQ